MPLFKYFRQLASSVIYKIRMPRLPPSGWRRTAVINTIVSGILASVLVGFCIALCLESSILGNTVIWSGGCDKSTAVTITLHLLLNSMSSAILASSNFFMQVLASPSRLEVDAAHGKKMWTDIGIPSMRNLRFLSPFKVTLWFMFVLTSVPIHLIFNSAIFEINNANGDFAIALASESFVNGAPYYPPGASLIEGYIAPFSRSDTLNSMAANAHKWTRLDIDACSTYMYGCQPKTIYGNIIVVMTSQNTSSFTADGWVPNAIFNMKTDFNLTRAWELESNSCDNLENIHRISASDLPSLGLNTSEGVGNYGDFWAQDMPLNNPNSLWYYTGWTKYLAVTFCHYGFDDQDNILPVGPHSMDFPSAGYLQPPPWNLTIPDGMWPAASVNSSTCTNNTINGRHTAIDLHASYCLAEPINPTCMIGASVPLLFAVAVSVILKTLLSVTVVYCLRKPVLVTPGDAIASFIQYPDPTTVGRVTLGQANTRLEVSKLVGRLEGRHFVSEAALLESVLRRPRLWGKASWSGISSVRRSAWISSYCLISGVLAIACFLLYSAFHSYRGLMKSLRPVAIGNDLVIKDLSVLGAVLIANAPQLLLTVGYFTYNTIFTRLVIAHEWFSYASAARPLRVTNPRGKQVSTYRLQLPYRYSIPLLALSILLHWMVSNTLYIVIIFGGFYSTTSYKVKGFSLAGAPADIDLSDLDMRVYYSNLSTLLVVVVAAAVAPVPLLMGLRRIRNSNMVGFPSNSLVISAACHVSTEAAFPSFHSSERPPTTQSREHGVEPEQVPAPDRAVVRVTQLGDSRRVGSRTASPDGPQAGHDAVHESGGLGLPVAGLESETSDDEKRTDDSLETAIQRQERLDRVQMSRSRLRWGEVRMPLSFYEHWADLQEPIGHLSFGTERQWLGEPQQGRLYA